MNPLFKTKTRHHGLSPKKDNKELEFKLFNLLRKKFSFCIQLKSGQLKQTHLLRQIRREIARIKFLYKKMV